MASHYIWDSSIQKISNRFFWHNIKGVTEEFVKKCDQCQKQGEIQKASIKLHSISIKTEIMQQFGIDMCSLLEADGLKHLMICKTILVNGRNPLKIKQPPPLLSSFMRLYVGMDVWRFRLTTKEGSLLIKLAKFYTIWSVLRSA